MGIAGLNSPRTVQGRNCFEYILNLESKKKRFTYRNPDHYIADYWGSWHSDFEL